MPSFLVPLSLAIGEPDTSQATESTLGAEIAKADARGTVQEAAVIEAFGKKRFVVNVNDHPAGSGFAVKTFDGMTLNAEANTPIHVIAL